MKAIYDTPLPRGWSEEPLAKLVVTRRGYTWEKGDEVDRAEVDTIPVIRIPNVQDTLDLTDLIHLRNVSTDAIERAAVTKGWLLFVGSNGTQDRIGDSVLIEEDRPMVFASLLMGIHPKDQNTLRSNFFAHWMRLHMVHEIFSKTSQQTTGLANFSWGAVKRLPVRFPECTEEQRRIAAALKLADEAIQKARAESDCARELFRALLKSLFEFGVAAPDGLHHSKWLTCPAHWSIQPLKKISSIHSGFTMGRDLSRAETITVPYVTVVNVQDGRFDLRGISSVEIKREELATATLRHGDILMTEGGDRDKLGRGAMWRNEVDQCVFQNHIFRVRLGPDYKSELFHFLIQTYQAKRYFYAHAKQTSNLCTINSRELKNWPVAIPPIPEQERRQAQT
jgi:type I restriction enzyme, S subunit